MGFALAAGVSAATLLAATAGLSVEAARPDPAVATVVAYLADARGDAGAGAVGATVRAAPARQATGDPALGKEYFSGVRSFQNGGPPCMACHSVAALGALGGGVLGPDLTLAFRKFSAAGLAPILATMPFPTMRPIFGTRQLTPQEQADILAFLQQAAVAERPVEAVGQIALLATGGAVVLLLLAQLLWRRRLRGVRQPLLGRR